MYKEKSYCCVFTFQSYLMILETIFKFKLIGRKTSKKLINKNTFYLILTTLNIPIEMICQYFFFF